LDWHACGIPNGGASRISSRNKKKPLAGGVAEVCALTRATVDRRKRVGRRGALRCARLRRGTVGERKRVGVGAEHTSVCGALGAFCYEEENQDSDPGKWTMDIFLLEIKD